MDILELVQNNWQAISGGIAGLTGGVLALMRKERRSVRDICLMMFSGLSCAVFVGNALCSFFSWMTNDLCLLSKFVLGLTSLSVLDGFAWLGNEFKKKPIEFIKYLLNYGSDSKDSKK